MEIIVDSNKSVVIKRIHQWLTYDGLLEGLPTTKMNARILASVTEVAKRTFLSKEVYVIEPTQSLIEYEGRYPFGNPARLPSVVCVADLWYYKAVGLNLFNKDYSALTIVWFQNEFAFPIAADVIAKLKALPWSRVASNFEY